MNARSRKALLERMARGMPEPSFPPAPVRTAEERDREAREAILALLRADAAGEPVSEGGRMALAIIERYSPALRRMFREERDGAEGKEDGP